MPGSRGLGRQIRGTAGTASPSLVASIPVHNRGGGADTGPARRQGRAYLPKSLTSLMGLGCGTVRVCPPTSTEDVPGGDGSVPWGRRPRPTRSSGRRQPSGRPPNLPPTWPPCEGGRVRCTRAGIARGCTLEMRRAAPGCSREAAAGRRVEAQRGGLSQRDHRGRARTVGRSVGASKPLNGHAARTERQPVRSPTVLPMRVATRRHWRPPRSVSVGPRRRLSLVGERFEPG